MNTSRMRQAIVSAAGLLALVFVCSATARAQGLWNGNFQSQPLPSDQVIYPDVDLIGLLIAAPSSGCPCRLLVSYYVPVRMASSLPNGGKIEAFVGAGEPPGVPLFTLASSAINLPAGANGALQASDYSPLTFPNSQPGQYVEVALWAYPSSSSNEALTASLQGAPAYLQAMFIPSD